LDVAEADPLGRSRTRVVTVASPLQGAVDVKDWASPVALARHVGRGDSAFPESPTWRRAFFAFPQERLRQRRDYVRAFVEFVRGVGGDSPVQAVGERTLVDLARRRLRVADPRRDGAVSDA
jgi:hypothetical protein